MLTITIGFIFTVLSSYVAADFVTGLFHWLEDTYGKKSWGQWLYRNIVLPNIEHHDSPINFTRSSYWNRVELSVYLAAPLVIVGLFVHCPWLISFALFASQANEIHCWAHRGGGNNLAVRTLQTCRIVQRSKHHGVHHKAPYRSRYCVMTPWLNPILDGLKFWRAIEYTLACCAVQPRDFKVSI